MERKKRVVPGECSACHLKGNKTSECDSCGGHVYTKGDSYRINRTQTVRKYRMELDQHARRLRA